MGNVAMDEVPAETTTATAMACAHESCRLGSLLTASSNAAVDNLAETTNGRLQVPLARYVSKQWENNLLEHGNAALKDVVYPEKIRK